MEAINQFVEAQMRRQHIPGLSLAVVQDGQLLLTRGYGMADVELNVAATPETVYQIQSITKTFTASAIMMLNKEGKVGLDDEIGKYLHQLVLAGSQWTMMSEGTIDSNISRKQFGVIDTQDFLEQLVEMDLRGLPRIAIVSQRLPRDVCNALQLSFRIK